MQNLKIFKNLSLPILKRLKLSVWERTQKVLSSELLIRTLVCDKETIVFFTDYSQTLLTPSVCVLNSIPF